jgi:hypothetical protein
MKQLPFYAIDPATAVGFDAEQQTVILIQGDPDDEESDEADVVEFHVSTLLNLMGLIRTHLDDNGRLIPMESISVQ